MAYKPKRSYRKRPVKKGTKTTNKYLKSIAKSDKIIATTSSTVRLLNPQRKRIVRIVKSTIPIAMGGAGTAGNAYQWTFVNNAFPGNGLVMNFDPTGNYGNNSSTLGPLAIPQWSSYQGLYSYYKVNKITLVFTAYDSGAGGLQSGNPVMLIKKFTKYITASLVPSLATLANQQGVIEKTFTAPQNSFKYSFKPQVQVLVDNPSVLSAEARELKPMGWVSTASPVQLYGIMLYMNTIVTQQWVNLDIEYDISFKEEQ
jgi:hypothetical protein